MTEKNDNNRMDPDLKAKRLPENTTICTNLDMEERIWLNLKAAEGSPNNKESNRPGSQVKTVAKYQKVVTDR